MNDANSAGSSLDVSADAIYGYQTPSGLPELETLFFQTSTDDPLSQGVGPNLTFTPSTYYGVTNAGRALFPAELIITEEGETVSAAPEPSTWALMMMGVGLVGVIVRRAKRRHGYRLVA